ncbi:MAG: serine--tRNA ligase, partial [Gammaproteobacteria bacterium]|nr:serine--tRNA ligase [Gammaproteobacteria bacterium]
MLDPQLLRSNFPDIVEILRTRRGFEIDQDRFLRLEESRKSLQTKTESLQSERNSLSRRVGEAKAKGESVDTLLQQVAGIKERLGVQEVELNNVQVELTALLMEIPNIPDDTVPDGSSEADNVCVRQWGQPREFDFEPEDHVTLGSNLGLLDFDTAAKLTGSRFVVMRGALARLHRGLIQFMLDVHTKEHGYSEIYVPYMVNSVCLYGTGQLPKFEEDQFALKGDQDFYLIPTAEVPVTNTVRDTIVEANQLPLKMVCHTPCFRREAGSYGKDTRGMIRQHQFEKVELVHIVRPTESYGQLEELTANAEAILQRLELPYRVVA